jgi:mannose-6-phosphate isomerase-like protein (cupin superfamily)
MNPKTYDLSSTYVRLRGDASVEPLAVDDTFWERISKGELGSFHNEYLVTSHSFDSDWSVWEMHPNGDEIVYLISGAVTFILKIEGEPRGLELEEGGQYVIVPKGVWHTARTGKSSRMLFITAGEGTRHRDVTPGGTVSRESDWRRPRAEHRAGCPRACTPRNHR